MQTIVSLSDRGTLTLPASVRKQLGVQAGQHFIVDITATGELLLKPAAVLPVEMYSEERIAEFFADEDAIARALPSTA